MGNREEFNKWYWSHNWNLPKKEAHWECWQARQPEIDALKERHSLCELALDSRDGNINTLIKESAALKAEVDRLKKPHHVRWRASEADIEG